MPLLVGAWVGLRLGRQSMRCERGSGVSRVVLQLHLMRPDVGVRTMAFSSSSSHPSITSSSPLDGTARPSAPKDELRRNNRIRHVCVKYAHALSSLIFQSVRSASGFMTLPSESSSASEEPQVFEDRLWRLVGSAWCYLKDLSSASQSDLGSL